MESHRKTRARAPAITITTAILLRRPLYVALSALMALIAVVGFWPTYYGPLARLSLTQPPLIHLHALVFTGWLALFSAQAVLAATGRLRWHLRLGRVGTAYGVAVAIMGLTTGVMRAAALRASSVRLCGSGGDLRRTRG